MRPNGAVISVDSPGTRPSTARKNSADWSKSSIDSVIDTWSIAAEQRRRAGRRPGRIEVVEPADARGRSRRRTAQCRPAWRPSSGRSRQVRDVGEASAPAADPPVASKQPGPRSRPPARRSMRSRGRSIARGARLSRSRASPCSHSCTGLERCCPTWANPRAVRARETSGADTSSTASSANAKPPSRGAGGRSPCGDCSGAFSRAARGHRLCQREQRAHRVGGGMPGIFLLVDVVEDFERDRAGVAHGQDLAEETRHVERALSREHPVVEAPLAHIHVQSRRVGELDVEHLVAGHLRDHGGIVVPGTAHGSCRDTARARGGRRAGRCARHPRAYESVPTARLRRRAGVRAARRGRPARAAAPQRGRRRRVPSWFSTSSTPGRARRALPAGRTSARRDAGWRRTGRAGPSRRGTADRPRSTGRGPQPPRPAGRATTAT